jgi:type IV pilus assembly protein PilW
MSYSPKADETKLNLRLSSCENNERGFTIIELVVGLAIGLILLGVAVKIFLVQQRSYSVQEQLSEMQQNIRAAMDMIVRETKMAGYNPTGATFDGIEYDATKTQLRILADLNGDGTTTATTNEDITYKYYDDTDDDYPLQIKRKSGSGYFQPLAENIHAFAIEYYDANGDTTIISTDIRQVEIKITGRTDKTDPDLDRVDGPLAFGYRYGTLTTHVTPENLDF